MCSHLHSYFEGNVYKRKCKLAYDCQQLTGVQRHIWCQIYFSILAQILKIEKNIIHEFQLIDTVWIIQDLRNLERAILHYVAGATIHEATKSVCESSCNHYLNSINKSPIEYRCCQLIDSIRLPEGYALKHTVDSQSLKEIFTNTVQIKGIDNNLRWSVHFLQVFVLQSQECANFSEPWKK